MSVDTKVTPIPADAFSVEEKTGDTPAVNEAEFAAAEAAAKAKAEQGNASAYVHKLKKPFTFEGCTIEELSFDFDRLTGNDSLAIEDELQSMNKPVIVPTFSGQYLIRMAARACTTTLTTPDGRARRIGADVIQALPSVTTTASGRRRGLFCWPRSCNLRRRGMAPKTVPYHGAEQQHAGFLLGRASLVLADEVDQGQ